MDITVPAPAKLNLYLHVVGKRPDGYHLLDSLIAFADIGDSVTASPTPGRDLTLTVDGPFAAGLSDEPDNLVLRAARALRQATGAGDGAHLTLIKNLPVASGIGGGSADAAAALKALSLLWGASLPADDMARLSLDLGADVPICFHGRPAFVSGIGEKITPAPALPDTPLVLINPLVPVATPPVFKARTGPFQTEAPFTGVPESPHALAKTLADRTNGLEAPAKTVAPEITQVLDAILETDDVLLARMSGSGATCFGLYATPESAKEAQRNIANTHPGWWCQAGQILS